MTAPTGASTYKEPHKEPQQEPRPEPASVEADPALASDRSQNPEAPPVSRGSLRGELTVSREAQPRQSLWRRIKMRTRGADGAGSRSSEAVETRLAAIEGQLEQLDADVRGQLDTLSSRLEEVWEAEEQLSQLADLQEKLDRLTQHQTHLAESVGGLKRILAWLAVLVVVAAAGAEIALNYLL